MSSRRLTYTQMLQYPSFEERFEYLRLSGVVGESTFGHSRWMNQDFYRSYEWNDVREFVITRDLGRDLASTDHDIFGKILVHHMNPIQPDEIEHGDADILDPEYLITVSHNTHNAIHYGDATLLPKPMVVRSPGDTTPWR